MNLEPVGIPLGIQKNTQFLPFQQIPNGILTLYQILLESTGTHGGG